MAGVKAEWLFTCVGWQVTLCDPYGRWSSVGLRWLTVRSYRQSLTFSILNEISLRCEVTGTRWSRLQIYELRWLSDGRQMLTRTTHLFWRCAAKILHRRRVAHPFTASEKLDSSLFCRVNCVTETYCETFRYLGQDLWLNALVACTAANLATKISGQQCCVFKWNPNEVFTNYLT